MIKKAKNTDEYISLSQEFAQPILKYLRECILEVEPMLTEEIKWNFPNFCFQGKIVASMAAFKNHCSLSFWNLSKEQQAHLGFKESKDGMGDLGKITALEDLPSKEWIQNCVREGIYAIKNGIKPTKKPKNSIEVTPTAEMLEALALDPHANEQFEKLSPSHKKEYIEWISEAKTQKTKDKRIQTMIEWLKEGKSRNWKYQK